MPPSSPSPDTLELHGLHLRPDLFRGATARKVERLLARGADPNPPSMDFALDADREPAYLLYNAVAEGQVPWVARLLQCGATPSPPVPDALLDDDTHTPVGAFHALGCAVGTLAMNHGSKHLEVLRLLLAAGADPLEHDPFTLRTPWEEFIREMREAVARDPELAPLAIEAFEAFRGALPAHLAAGLDAVLAQGGDRSFPEAATLLSWPGMREHLLRRHLDQALHPAVPAVPAPRL